LCINEQEAAIHGFGELSLHQHWQHSKQCIDPTVDPAENEEQFELQQEPERYVAAVPTESRQ